MAANSEKVEQFVLLAKAARGLALVDLISKATAEPGMFSYGELLSLPSVQEASRLLDDRANCNTCSTKACDDMRLNAQH